MATDNDSELRDLVTQTLESNGVLGKIRAQLRASVFLALEEQDALRNKAPSVNKDLKNFLLTREGLLVFSLLREFLEFYNLEFTLAVLDTESNTKDRLQRNDLCDEYQLKSCKVPVVTELLRHTSGRSNTVTSEASSAKSSSQMESVSSQQLASENENTYNDSHAKETADDDTSAKITHSADQNHVEPDVAAEKSDNSIASSLDDPFFDEPPPLENEIPTPLLKQLQGQDDEKKQSTCDDNVPKSTEAKMNSEKQVADDIPENEDEPKLSKNLPSLSAENKDEDARSPTWNDIAAIDKRIADLGFEIPADGEYEDDFSSTTRSKSEKNVHSDASIEEDIDEVSGIDDILTSHSDGDDLTTDKTVSQIDGKSGVDYMETVE